MEVEVLVSCMNQKDFSLVENLNIQTSAVIINQTFENSYSELSYNNNIIKYISSHERGLTKSRNLALSYATKDICILCDDDVNYYSNYNETILNAFYELPDADIIVFDIERINYNGNARPIKKVKKASPFKSYGSVRIAFRRESIQKKNIWFDINFGAGSIFSSGEETILLKDARKKKLNIYEYPSVIAKVDFKESTWREGYNEKFFYDKGALLAASYPFIKYIFMFYFVYKLRKLSELSTLNIMKCLISGMKGFKQSNPYIQLNRS